MFMFDDDFFHFRISRSKTRNNNFNRHKTSDASEMQTFLALFSL